MIDTSVLLPFILSSLVIILSPGADTFLLLRFAIRGGPSAGFAAMAGISARAGLRTLRVPVDSSSAVLQGTDKPLRMSLITNVTNPKVLIFYLAFFPRFLGQAESAVLQAHTVERGVPRRHHHLASRAGLCRQRSPQLFPPPSRRSCYGVHCRGSFPSAGDSASDQPLGGGLSDFLPHLRDYPPLAIKVGEVEIVLHDSTKHL